MSERDPQVPETVEGEPVVDVQPATDPLTSNEIREAQETEPLTAEELREADEREQMGKEPDESS